MGKPFRMGSQAGSPSSAEEKAAPPPGDGIKESRETGQPLKTPSQEAGANGHSVPIPWPAAGGADDQHKPMKFTK